jgi:hypothetical protein
MVKLSSKMSLPQGRFDPTTGPYLDISLRLVGWTKFVHPTSPKRSAYDENRHKQNFLCLGNIQVAIVAT